MAVGRIKIAGLDDALGRQRACSCSTASRTASAASAGSASTEVEEEPTALPLRLTGKGIKVSRPRLGAERKDFVAWIYADPVGPEHNTLNCSISDLELDVERDGRPAERLSVSAPPPTSSAPATPTTASRSSPTRTATAASAGAG